MLDYSIMELFVRAVFWIIIGIAGLVILFALAQALGEKIAQGFINGLEAKGIKGVLLLEEKELREEEI